VALERMSYVPRFMAFALREWLLGGVGLGSVRTNPVRGTSPVRAPRAGTAP
jgi:hypothetical protein